MKLRQVRSILLLTAMVLGPLTIAITHKVDANGSLQEVTIEVPGNSGRRWVDSGIDVSNGTLLQIAASGRVDVSRGVVVGPEGSSSRSTGRGFPADTTPYGLTIRLTSSRTNPDDELREDYGYVPFLTICSRSNSRVWLTVNDNESEDNAGSFVVIIGRGSCAATDTRVQGTTIRVSDERNNNVEGAEVYVNGERAGATSNSGTLFLPPLKPGDQIIARKLISENATYRNNHDQGSTRNWNYRTYITTMPVNEDGSVSPHVVREASATQELVLRRSDTLVGIHVLASLEWDATQRELNLHRYELQRMSQYLYNATDGQFFVERIDLYDDARYWDDTDFRIFANLNVRPNVNLRLGGFRHSGFGTWMNMRRQISTNPDSWSWFVTFAHEFGHYGFDIGDEYADGDASVFCAANLNSTRGDFRADQPRASCMMSTQFRAGKLCSNNSQNPHRHGTRQGEESCWAHLANEYRDNNSTARWIIQTPDSRRAIVDQLPDLPSAWQPQINVENRSRSFNALCQQFDFRVTNSADQPLNGVEVWLRTSYGQNILQGTTGNYDSGGPRINFGNGVIPITGAHVGDRISAGGADYIVRESDCFSSASRREKSSAGVDFLKVAAHAQTRSQSPIVSVRLSSESASMSASIEPVGNDGTLIARVQSDTRFRSSIKAQVAPVGSTNVLTLDMRFDPSTQMYSSDVFKLPIGTYANLQLSAADDRGQETTRNFSFVVSPVNGNKPSEIFSADGQFGLSVPGGGLPENAAVIVGPSSVALTQLESGYKVVSGPFRVSASNATRIGEGSIVRFQLPNLKGGRTTDGIDSRTFQILRHNPNSQRWEALGGTFLPAVDVISVPTNRLGDYLVVGRLPNEVVLRQPTPSDERPKPQEQIASTKFAVTEMTLKADEAIKTGVCPITVTFSGTITTNGAGSVRYMFIRNDGATGPVITVEFSEAGTQKVATSWIIGDFKGLPHYEGWQAIKILSPVEVESAHANFAIDCKQP